MSPNETDVDALAESVDSSGDRSRGKLIVGKLAELLAGQGIPVDEIGRVQRVNAWQGFHKSKAECPNCHGKTNDDGKVVGCAECGFKGWVFVNEKVDMVGISLRPKWEDGPAWPVVQRADPVRVNVRPLKPHRLDGIARAAILPDLQIGFRQLRSEEGLYLDPFHDERAIACALALLRVTRPDLVVILGDCLDLPAQSKYVQEPSWALTTQDAINRFYRLLVEIRSMLPDSRVVVLEGNHDLRLHRSIMVNAAWAFGLTRAETPRDWPVLSVPNLCRFDELNVEYVEGYPANEFWINEALVCIHGRMIGNATKSAASRVVEDERVNVIFGHTHTVEMRQKTRRVYQGQRTSFAASPGCLCRIDGAVPSVKGGIDLLGRPLVSYENWQQGSALVTYEIDGDLAHYEHLSIYGGRAIWRDRFFDAGKVA